MEGGYGKGMRRERERGAEGGVRKSHCVIRIYPQIKTIFVIVFNFLLLKCLILTEMRPMGNLCSVLSSRVLGLI